MPEVLVISATEQLALDGDAQALVEQIVEQELLEVAVQGPPGPQGPQGVSGGAAGAVTLAEAVGGHRAVYLTAAGALYADAGTAEHAGRVAGITTQAGAAGASVLVQSAGFMTEPSWAWVPGGDIWLGLSGVLTQTIPPAAAFAQRLGYAVTPTDIWVEISEPIIF